ncbi:T9SS type A sorting domain-containing protein [Bacteroides nordii]|uniref:T9SS type A sorting domain-containing protein n=1 Tax=Bacteroides nordii TaxID=291645 RepID=UPI003999CE20
MKTFFLFLLFSATIAVGTNVSAQTVQLQYSYDSAGNRVSRLLVTSRSFSPFIENDSLENDTWENKLSRENIRVYPTPVIIDLTVSLSGLPEPGVGTLQLYDMQGKLLLKETVRTTETVISMREFIPGVYIMKLVFGQMQSAWKIIKE